MTSQIRTIKEIAKSTLDGNGYRYEENGDILRFYVEGNHCSVIVNMLCKEDINLLAVYTTVNLYVQEDKQAEIIEQLNRWNNQSMISTLYLNPDDGRVVCRAACNSNDHALNETVVHLVLASAVDVIDTVYPDIIRMCSGV